MNRKKKIFISSSNFLFYIVLIIFAIFLFFILNFPFFFDYGSFFKNFSSQQKYCLKSHRITDSVKKEKRKKLKEKNSILSSFRDFKKTNIKNKISTFLDSNDIKFSSLNNSQTRKIDEFIIDLKNLSINSIKDDLFQEKFNTLSKNISNFMKEFNIEKNYGSFVKNDTDINFYNNSYSHDFNNNGNDYSSIFNFLSTFFNTTDKIMDSLLDTSVKALNTTSSLMVISSPFSSKNILNYQI